MHMSDFPLGLQVYSTNSNHTNTIRCVNKHLYAREIVVFSPIGFDLSQSRVNLVHFKWLKETRSANIAQW
jgi:hypothetical protein